MIHEPITGRPGKILQLSSMFRPSGWLLCSVCIERIRHSSSATVPNCGSTSEISMPHSPVAAEFKRTRKQYVVIVGLMDLHAVGMRLAAAFGQLRLGIEQVHLAGPAILHQLDDGFGRAWEMTLPWKQIAKELPRLRSDRQNPPQTILPSSATRPAPNSQIPALSSSAIPAGKECED